MSSTGSPDPTTSYSTMDDEVAKGSTVMELLDRLRDQKVNEIRVACTHGPFSADALDRLDHQDDVLEIVCTNTVPIPQAKRVPKLQILRWERWASHLGCDARAVRRATKDR